MPQTSRLGKVHFARLYRRAHGNRPLPHHACAHRLKMRHGWPTLYQLRLWLSGRLSSLSFLLHPGQALGLQNRYACEFACDWAIDLARHRAFHLATHGCDGGIGSDALFYYLLSPRFLVVPGYHTHQSMENELGQRMPSMADYLALGKLQQDLGANKLRLALKLVLRKNLWPSKRRRWLLQRWQPPLAPPLETARPFASRPVEKQGFPALTPCLRRLKAQVYFADCGPPVEYALNRHSRGVKRYSPVATWQAAWEGQPDSDIPTLLSPTAIQSS